MHHLLLHHKDNRADRVDFIYSLQEHFILFNCLLFQKWAQIFTKSAVWGHKLYMYLI